MQQCRHNQRGGYLFIHAQKEDIENILGLITPLRYLARDLATMHAAKIPLREMEDFMKYYNACPYNIEFLEHPLYEYAKNRQRVRISAGILKGTEGYIVRLHRDRHLVFSFGNMTIAISDVHSMPFETME